MAVVKADGYGHGLVPAARAVLAGGADSLGVAVLEEALALRAAGITAPLLAWLHGPGTDFAAALRADVEVSVNAEWGLAEVAAAARATGRPARLHLFADTGLSREGATPADWPGLVAAAARAQHDGDVEVVGLWTHMAFAAAPAHPSIAGQIRLFEEAAGIPRRAGPPPHRRQDPPLRRGGGHRAPRRPHRGPPAHGELRRDGRPPGGVVRLRPPRRRALRARPARGRPRRPRPSPGHDGPGAGGPHQAGSGRPRRVLRPDLLAADGDDAGARARGVCRRRHPGGGQPCAGAGRWSAADHRGAGVHGPVRARCRQLARGARRRGRALGAGVPG